jgi:phospholipid/cholesterol/gamma-HCH transport system ATP-binding protein
MIEIYNLKKSFNGQPVLNGVNLKIRDGELLAIVGQSGVGKSVLIKMLIGIHQPDDGKILIQGEDIIEICKDDVCSLRERFGVVFQGGALFDSMTVFENVAFPLQERTRLEEDVIRDKVTNALEEVGLRGVEDKYPAELSGGMKKRVALARALITEPSIVLFDEPTTGLDPIILRSIHNLIKEAHFRYGFTGVIISHEIPEIFEVADRIAMLYDGRIVEAGTPEEIVGSDNPVVRQFISGSLEGPIEVIR